MRILLATTSGAGHFGPMLPFAAACARAGHELLVAAPESFRTAVERTGYLYWPCGDIAPDDLAAAHARVLAAGPEKMNEATAEVGPTWRHGPSYRECWPPSTNGGRM